MCKRNFHAKLKTSKPTGAQSFLIIVSKIFLQKTEYISGCLVLIPRNKTVEPNVNTATSQKPVLPCYFMHTPQVLFGLMHLHPRFSSSIVFQPSSSTIKVHFSSYIERCQTTTFLKFSVVVCFPIYATTHHTNWLREVHCAFSLVIIPPTKGIVVLILQQIEFTPLAMLNSTNIFFLFHAPQLHRI